MRKIRIRGINRSENEDAEIEYSAAGFNYIQNVQGVQFKLAVTLK